MREITHQLAFPHSSEGSRYSDVFDPNDGGVQARVALGDRAVLDRAVAGVPETAPSLFQLWDEDVRGVPPRA